MTLERGYILIEGQIFALQSSTSDPVRLVIHNNSYSVESHGQKIGLNGDIADLKIEPAIGSADRQIYLPGGELFTTGDLDQVKLIKNGGFWSGLAKTERFGWHLLPLAIATPFLAFGLYRTLIPLFISFAMFMTPDAILRTIDNNTLRTIDFKLTKPTELEQSRQDEIQAIFQSLVTSATENSEKTRRIPAYKLHFRNSEIIGPNAFALPGGTIVMTDALIEMFPEQDHVLSAVLAHEIGHVEHEHSLRQIYRALGMAAIIGLIAGDAGPMLEEIVLEGSALLSLSFSRKHEMQADDYSYELLSQSGHRADGLIEFFEKLEEDIPIPDKGEWMMTHPLSKKRIENIQNHLDSDS